MVSASQKNPELKAALSKILPVAAGYLVMGFGFGVLMAARAIPFTGRGW